MNNPGLASAPVLNRLQLAWLQEIGLDRHMLARWAAPSAPQISQPTPQSVQITPQASQQPALALKSLLAATPQVQIKSPASPMQQEPESPLVLPADWAALEAHAMACQRCELHVGRSSVVFGGGLTTAPDLMIIGEAPGASDDRRGLPFQGKPGQLLQAMLNSIQLSLPSVVRTPGTASTEPDATLETSIYCTNVTQCRPLGNRTPSPVEIAACMPYLLRQIELLQPKRILALGHLAVQALLQVETPLPQLRGQVHQWRSPTGTIIPLVASWHPATLLLHPQHKADVWHDLNLVHNLPV